MLFWPWGVSLPPSGFGGDGHSPLKNFHSSQTTPEGKVHIPTSPLSVRTMVSVPPAWVHAAEAGLAMANNKLNSVNTLRSFGN
jgi:hypothetical protein